MYVHNTRELYDTSSIYSFEQCGALEQLDTLTRLIYQ